MRRNEGGLWNRAPWIRKLTYANRPGWKAAACSAREWSVRRDPTRREHAPHANGAGIAADPTLTDAWASFRAMLAAEPRAIAVQERTWRPMSGPARAILRSSQQGFVTGARTGIRCSLLPCHCFRSRGFDRNRHAQSLDRGRVPLPFRFTAAPACAFAAPRSGQVLGPSGVTASRPSSTSRLAFGRSLLHAVSRRARGQMSPPSLG